jgi:hypothetical protein
MAIDVNKARVQFYLDTGAEVNIMSQGTYERIGAPTLQSCDIKARMYNGQTATFLGKGRAQFQRHKHTTSEVFYVAPRGSLNLLSYSTMRRLGLYIMDAEADSSMGKHSNQLGTTTKWRGNSNRRFHSIK